MKKTPSEVKSFVRQYFARNKITQIEAGRKIGCLRQTVAGHLKDGEHYFPFKMAAALENGYGFRRDFLMYGIGEPLKPPPEFTVSSIREFVEKKLLFLRELPENIDVLKWAFDDVNPDMIKGMIRALEEMLEYIKKGESGTEFG